MAKSSIKSGIQLESYKVDKINFSCLEEIGVLAEKQFSNCNISWQFSFRNAKKISDNEKIFYITGLKINIVIKDIAMQRDIANGEFVITGLFLANGDFDKNTEENLIKHQCPALLFPYIRSAITMVLMNAGFSTIILPIVNVNVMAKDLNLKIE